MVAGLQKQAKAGAYDTITDPNRLAAFITLDLRRIIHDQHLNFRYAPALEKSIKVFNQTRQVDKSALEKAARENFGFQQTSVMPGNIGYISFIDFTDTSEQARKTIRAAMQIVVHTDELIIDLRDNYGGSGVMAGEIITYFFDRRTPTGRAYNRISDQWVDTYVSNQPDITKGLNLRMPLYLLVSNKTVSAAENFAYTLQTLRKARVFGEVTAGSVHLTRSFALGNGFVGFIPISRSENIVTKADVEGKGVLPDLVTSGDSALRKAGEYILTQRFDTAKAELSQQKISWELNAFRGSEAKIVIDDNVLEKYIGNYDGLIINFSNHRLSGRDTHGTDQNSVLRPITDVLFQMDLHSQVEFIKDGSGIVSGAKLLWDDGWIDTLKRQANK